MDKKIDKKNIIRIEEIALGLDESEELLCSKIANIFSMEIDKVFDYMIIKKALDSRNKKNVLFKYTVDFYVNNFEEYFSRLSQDKIKQHKIRLHKPFMFAIKKSSKQNIKRPIVVGSGPSGLFATLLLAKAGLNPLVIERGKDVDSRVKDINLFAAKGELNENSNIQFGEGGAGTFSDGKLYTLINNPKSKFVFEEFIKAGAPKEIAYDANPHIGTDKLRMIVKNIRKEIIKLGGEVRFEVCLTDIEVKNDKIISITVNNKEKIEVNNLLIAIGHSARDTYEMLYRRKLKIGQKPFAIGLRIEHKAEMINKSQYGVNFNHPKLSTARYKLVAHIPMKRSVYTFCMCPGGYVVPASSEKGSLAINGMSEYKRDSENSNSALLVGIMPDDFGSSHPLAGVEYQRKWEKKAFEAGGSNYRAPAQLVGDFLANKETVIHKSIKPTYKPGVNYTSLDECLPDYVIDSIRSSLPIFENKLKGFSHPDSVLTGVETRSSAPVRLYRDENFQSNIKGLYPVGEGAGYAGGIVSSAIDGVKVAEEILDNLLGD